MQPPLPTGSPPRSAPRFSVIEGQPLRPAALVLAILAAVGGLSLITFGRAHSRTVRLRDADAAARQPYPKSGSKTSEEDEKDDPSQIDVITLGDAADAPVPAHRSGHAGSVHPTIIVPLPRFGEQVGLIPDTASGHLLYAWLAAFNQANSAALKKVLPNTAPALTAAAQMELRRQTGGFNLLSARQVGPGVLVFRLRDQTPLATEVLGTLQADTGANPPVIISLSLRAVLP